MVRSSVLASLGLLCIAPGALAGTYTQSAKVVGSEFESFFSYQAIADPTHGRVNYVNQATANSKNLTYSNGDTFILRADDTTVLSASGAGRNSVRLMSLTAYTTHVVVFYMRHMPTGCGTWPAVWETNQNNWPAGGEVDIVEGVNLNTDDQTTLHTSPGCTMPSGIDQSGTALYANCNTAVNSNSGCGVQNTLPNNYGAPFNAAGGGWYAMERTPDEIKVWFWSQDNAGSAPTGMKNGDTSINTDNWGQPVAYFPNTDCNLASLFSENNIIINLTFCGDWAGSSSVYASSGCPSTCVDYVNNNPSAFSEAYFDFGFMTVYE